MTTGMSVESRMRGNSHVRFGGRPGKRTGREAGTAPQVDPYSVGVVCPLAPASSNARRVAVRAIGMDVHRDFCEIAIAEDGKVRSAGRIATAGGAGAVRAQPGYG